MSRYIDADKIPWESTVFFDFLIAFKEDIDRMPFEDVVEVKHGKWEKHGMDIAYHPLRCSVCSWGNHHIGNSYVMDMDYCPNCGARMDGAE